MVAQTQHRSGSGRAQALAADAGRWRTRPSDAGVGGEDAGRSKYPPAEPGALDQEPLKAAYPCRSSQASLHSVNASPSAEPPQLGKLRYLLFATSAWCALNLSMKLPFVCLAAHDSELYR